MVRVFLCGTVCTCLIGCKTPELVIVDQAGAPVEGARVVGTSLSMSGHSSCSDGRGLAKIPHAVQETKWISVSKNGYISVSGVDVSQEKPIIVELIKVDE